MRWFFGDFKTSAGEYDKRFTSVYYLIILPVCIFMLFVFAGFRFGLEFGVVSTGFGGFLTVKYYERLLSRFK